MLRSLARHCSISKRVEGGQRGCNFHLATVCFTCAVISDKRSGRKPKEGTKAEEGKVEIKQHESAIYTFKIQIKSFACRHDERGRRQGQTRQTLTAAATYAMRLTSRESDLLAGWLTFELGLDYFGCSIHLSSLVPWPNLASAQNTKT